MTSDPRLRALGDPEPEANLHPADVAHGALLVGRDILLVLGGLVALAILIAAGIALIAAPFVAAENSEQIWDWLLDLHGPLIVVKLAALGALGGLGAAYVLGSIIWLAGALGRRGRTHRTKKAAAPIDHERGAE